MLFGFAGDILGRLPPGVRPSGCLSIMGEVVVPYLFVGALVWFPTRPFIPGAANMTGLVGWTDWGSRGGSGEVTAAWVTRDREVGRDPAGLVCTNLVASEVAIQGGEFAGYTRRIVPY